MYMRILILLLLSTSAFSTTKPNAIYAQLGGGGLMLSTNYERCIYKNLHTHLGIGLYGLHKQYATYPIGINYILPLKKEKLFVDMGYSATYSNADVKLYIVAKLGPDYKQTIFWNHVPHIGLRLHSKRNMLIKADIAPVINGWGFIPNIGLSIGKLF
jgi:hypothetical protein